jgi:hypothetical protein
MIQTGRSGPMSSHVKEERRKLRSWHPLVYSDLFHFTSDSRHLAFFDILYNYYLSLRLYLSSLGFCLGVYVCLPALSGAADLSPASLFIRP